MTISMNAIKLTRIAPGTWTACDGRFVVKSRIPGCDSGNCGGYYITDTSKPEGTDRTSYVASKAKIALSINLSLEAK